jgi:hypothetical protein
MAAMQSVFVHEVVVAQHLGVGGERAAGHGRPRDHRFDGFGLRRQEVVLHALLGDQLGLHQLVDVDAQIVVGAAQGVPERGDVGLAGAAGHGGDGAVDLVGAGLDGGLVADGSDAGGLMGVEDDVACRRQQLARLLDRLVDVGGDGGAGGVLEADAVKGECPRRGCF